MGFLASAKAHPEPKLARDKAFDRPTAGCDAVAIERSEQARHSTFRSASTAACCRRNLQKKTSLPAPTA